MGLEGYLSSYVTQQTQCGNSDNPWILTVSGGQRINIVLLDFANNIQSSTPTVAHDCVVYATIKDSSETVTHTVCGGGGKRTTPVFISVSNSVEIRLNVKQSKPDGHFLLKYTGIQPIIQPKS